MKTLIIKNGKVVKNDFIGTDLTLDIKGINNKTGETFAMVLGTAKGLYETEGLAWQSKLHHIFSTCKSKKWKYNDFDLVAYEMSEFSENELWGDLVSDEDEDEYSIF